MSWPAITKPLIALSGLGLASATPLIAEPLAGQIWDVSQNSFVNFSNMLENISDKTYIIMGERHGRKAHQGREAFLIGALAEAGRYPTIAFEMLNHKQDIIVETYREKSPEYALGLAVPLKWSDSNWPAWSFYQPVFDVAFATKAKIIGADLTDAKQGEARVSKTSGASAPTTSPAYYQNQMTVAHCGLIEEDRAVELAYLQMARDQHMAKMLKDKRDPTHGGLLVVGSAHIRKSSGIPNYLPSNETAVIMMVETAVETIKFIQGHQEIISGRLTDFDYIWFTPKLEKTSLCDRIGKKVDTDND